MATVGISSLLIASQTISISADTADDIAYLEQQQAATSSELSAVQSAITDLEGQKSALLDKIDQYDQELVTVIASINLLDSQIADKEEELVQTAQNLEDAEKERDFEYEAMKERIRYIYEEGGKTGWASLLLTATGGLSAVLDQAQHTQDLYSYDRKELDAYSASVDRVEELQEQQIAQKSTLETLKKEQEAGKAHLEELLAGAEAESDQMDSRLAEANAVAAQYQALIEQQNAAIQELYIRQEEERRAAEEAAAREAAARAAASVINSVSESSEDDYEDDSYAEETYEDSSSDSYSETDEYSDSSSYSGDSSDYSESTSYVESGSQDDYTETTSSGGTSGQDVVNLALQYVGNPYVWGGTNPSTGADCSGFVQAIYNQLGYNISRTSYTQLNDGVAVSYADAQPGDIINYGHHVAIYMGDGQIVHAANEQLGITTSTNATYQPIVGVRRIIN